MTLFDALVDYAGLFPPAQLAMPQALAEYVRATHGPYRSMLGRFIVRASQIGELCSAMPDGGFALSVVADEGLEGLPALAQALRSSPRFSIGTLEIAGPLEQIDSLAQALRTSGFAGTPVFLEGASSGMEALARAGLGAKIRCGGARHVDYPHTRVVAAFIESACRARVPFKATAGLHHPIRHYDGEHGVMMHGFLNLLAATALARRGCSFDRILAAVECLDPSQFAVGGADFRFGDDAFDAAEIDGMRRESFIAYGSCSFVEPVEDLRALHMVA